MVQVLNQRFSAGQPALLLLRLLILGVGLGVLTGTVLKLLAPRFSDAGAGVSSAIPVINRGVGALLKRLQPHLLVFASMQFTSIVVVEAQVRVLQVLNWMNKSYLQKLVDD